MKANMDVFGRILRIYPNFIYIGLQITFLTVPLANVLVLGGMLFARGHPNFQRATSLPEGVRFAQG
jgi:hypothetical protein